MRLRVSPNPPPCSLLPAPAGDPGAAEEAAVVPGEPGDPDGRGRRLVPELLLSGHVPHPHLGAAAQPVSGGGAGEDPREAGAELCGPSPSPVPPSDLRHKEQAPLKYLALEEKLHKDPRLVEFLKVFV